MDKTKHTKGMKDSEVYLRAAEIIDADQEEFSCCAVDEAVGKFCLWTKQRFEYEELLRPARRKTPAWGMQFGATEKECKACRVLALLFMHQIALEGELNG
jgi:hypothetical protein